MSTARGDSGKRTRPPKHQNRFTFKHNPNSKKTKKIAGIQHFGLCRRCDEQIEWKKKYRKYKPRRTAGPCSVCRERKVKLAYHAMCSDCSRAKKSCAKCSRTFASLAATDSRDQALQESRRLAEELAKQEELLESHLDGLKEGERRNLQRRIEKEQVELRTSAAETVAMKDDDDDEL